MSTTPATTPSLGLSIGITDLTSASQLRKLIQGDAKPLFNFGAQIAPFWNSAVQLVPNRTSASITVSGPGNWKAGAVGFGLSASAKGQLQIVTSGPVLKYAPDLTSQATSEIPASPYPGSAYIVVSLEFQIAGTLLGSGNISAVGISGNAKGCSDRSIIFCHQVPEAMTLREALHDTFEKFAFAFEPTCAMDMDSGDVAQVNFNGSLACGFDVSYGIANLTFAAPGISSVAESVTRGAAQFKLPSGKIAIGASASVSYSHADDFTAIVQKLDHHDAFLYIMRARKNDLSEGLKLSATVTITDASQVTVDAQKLQQAIDGITTMGGAQAAAYASNVAQGLTRKLHSWIDDTVSKGVSLAAKWDQQQAASMLFKYKINLDNLDLVNRSWTSLGNGDLRSAGTSGGLIPEPGSGISREVSHSFTLSLQLFNFFAASGKSTYFEKTYITVTQNGDLRYMFDIGQELDIDVNKAKQTCLVHFLTTVDETTAREISRADVDLELELIATNNPKEAHRIGDTVGMIPPMKEVNLAQKTMQQFVAQNPSGTLHLVCILKPSVYGRLSCSEYVGKKPPNGQQQDSENWSRFHDASVALLDLEFVEGLTYKDWQRFNVVCVYGNGFSGTPDRRSEGNPVAVLPDFWRNVHADPRLVNYFMLNSAAFMNLCDDLHQLAGLATEPNNSANDITTYNSLLISLVKYIMTRDVNTDYSKPAIAAILRLSNPQKVTSDCVSAKNSLTCTLTLS